MPKYNVNFSMPVHFNVAVEADDPAAAEEAAMEFAWLTRFSGNGGVNKLIGTTEACVSIEPGDNILEGDGWEVAVCEC